MIVACDILNILVKTLCLENDCVANLDMILLTNRVINLNRSKFLKMNLNLLTNDRL